MLCKVNILTYKFRKNQFERKLEVTSYCLRVFGKYIKSIKHSVRVRSLSYLSGSYEPVKKDAVAVLCGTVSHCWNIQQYIQLLQTETLWIVQFVKLQNYANINFGESQKLKPLFLHNFFPNIRDKAVEKIVKKRLFAEKKIKLLFTN